MTHVTNCKGFVTNVQVLLYGLHLLCSINLKIKLYSKEEQPPKKEFKLRCLLVSDLGGCLILMLQCDDDIMRQCFPHYRIVALTHYRIAKES